MKNSVFMEEMDAFTYREKLAKDAPPAPTWAARATSPPTAASSTSLFAALVVKTIWLTPPITMSAPPISWKAVRVSPNRHRPRSDAMMVS